MQLVIFESERPSTLDMNAPALNKIPYFHDSTLPTTTVQQHITAHNAPTPLDLEVERVVETHPHDLFETHKTHAAKATALGTASQVVAEVNPLCAVAK